ncbi:MAG: Sec-independent protein translocase protein TatB [Mesorhizobium sp.]
MLEVGWSEMLVIAIVLIVVVGPKDLPKMLRTFGRTTSKMREMANDFRKQFDEAMKEADLDDVKSTIDSVRQMNPASDLKKALNPMEKAAADVRAGLQSALNPAPKPEAPAATVQPSEPLKTGASAMPAAVAEPAPPATQPAKAQAKPAPKAKLKAEAAKAAPGKATASKAASGKTASKPAKSKASS